VFKILAKDLLLLRTLCLLVSLAFALSGPAGATSQNPSDIPGLKNFTLPDGSLPVICYGNGTPDTEPGNHCDQCLQSWTPPLAAGEAPLTHPVRQISASRDAKRRQTDDDFHGVNAHPVRGPPLS